MRAREFFETVKNAAQDAETCEEQQRHLDDRALDFGGVGTEPSGRGAPDADKLPRRVVAAMDHERRMERRVEADGRLIDRACELLYGADQMGGGGLCREEPQGAAAWADVLYWYYCANASWRMTAHVMGFSERKCLELRDAALSWIDASDYGRELRDITAPWAMRGGR